ncbi:uncharacterized protein BO87DRAFT_366698 [Aspergillus neoniger CBS 115656]|uniref:FAD binding domain protein n=1 Tax=Aspergillus neoniger (strain CBS 115656) TaxID=1448310 RepID=A0A318Y8L1_ASPNB|nr:hypothetical protein BO87DRAFT_366698 [Aspergillus neoniger CBS 115656]PYH30616.1 hypothetical protein BO87DRAFT_366698 [Aspergillus neoniger CBS 115656]
MDLRANLVKGIASGIGLASESISAYKASREEKKANASDTDNTVREATTGDADEVEHLINEQHEEEWVLDEAQDELAGDEHCAESEPAGGDIEGLAVSFLQNYPAPPPYAPTSDLPRLSCPVVLPQRRPKSRKRGFIRAYAPALEGFGVDKTMFLDFLETSNRACQATPWLQAINLASIGTMFIPEPISIAVSILIQLATDVAMAVDGRRRTNKFFDKINDEFFRPRGLFCLVMTWKPGSDSPYATFDMNSTISAAIEHGGAGLMNKVRHRLKSSDAKTHGVLPFSECAPLIFPDLDELAEHRGDNQSKLKGTKRRKEFVSDYWDRRSQAKFMMKNPDSALSQGHKPTFTSRYADPSHPASSGSLVGLLTGGHMTGERLVQLRGGGNGTDRRRGLGRQSIESPPLSLGGLAAGIRAARLGRLPMEDPQGQDEMHREESYQHSPTHTSYGGQSVPGRGRGIRDLRQTGPLGSPIGGIKKLLKENIIYLMIVNMPSEEDMEAARRILQS